MISVVCWKWGSLFGPEYVNRLHRALQKHLRLDHRLFCVTDDSRGIDTEIATLPITAHTATPRCRRRMKQFDRAFGELVGPRILSIDLDVVIVGDITPVVNRHEPIVGWKVGYAKVYSGSFFLFNAGALHSLWDAFNRAPEAFPRQVQARGVPSDQAMLNYWLKTQSPIGEWTEDDGFVTYFGEGYERLEHHGIGPTRQTLPPGARIVVLGSADKAVMDEGRYPWVREHWSGLEVAA